MKILIEEAERLYRQIDKAQVHLINARLQKDEEGKKSAISEMETAMCDASRLLKCLIERKDNIVDLSEVWHEASERPRAKEWILVQFEGDEYETLALSESGMNTWFNTWVDEYRAIRWAYITDLLPKGGEK